jgi:hypothetical protein
MKMALKALTLLMVFSPFAYAESSDVTFNGTIQSVLIGEVDPHIVGDICLIDLATDEGAVIGLVTDHDSCVDNQDELLYGRGLTVSVLPENKITDSAKYDLLKWKSHAKAFYDVEFGAIDNGLADLPPAEGKIEIRKDVVKTAATCTHAEGDRAYKLGLIEVREAKTSYSIVVARVKEDGTNPLILFRGITKVAGDGKTSEYKNEFGTVKFERTGSKSATAFVNLKMRDFVLGHVTMSCELDSTINYDQVLFLEPRVIISN